MPALFGSGPTPGDGRPTLGGLPCRIEDHLLQSMPGRHFERVPNAGRNTVAQRSAVMSWEVCSINLELADQWPNRRNRWWALLHPKGWLTEGIKPWPRNTDFDTIQDILQDWCHWPAERRTTAQALRPEYGSDRRVLGLLQRTIWVPMWVPTAGLQHVLASGEGPPRFYIHSSNSPPSTRGRTTPWRSIIDHLLRRPQIRPLSNHMQMVWIYAQLWCNFAKATARDTVLTPAIILRNYQQELLSQFAAAHPNSRTINQVKTDEGLPLQLPSQCTIPAHAVLLAERINDG